MKKLLLLAFLFPSLVWASNWVLSGETTDGDKFYIDTESIQRNGNVVNFWEKVNFKQRKSKALSMKSQVAFNCGTTELKTNYNIFYSGLDNQGTALQSGDPFDSWAPVPPDTVAETEMNFVCKR